jgi:hypothetical protein
MTCEDLQNMKNDLSEDYYLVNDIDCSPTNPGSPSFDPGGPWGDGNGFEPVGNLFTGTLDGRGYKITDLYISRPSTDQVGLIKYAWTGSEFKNIELEDVDITGHRSVGALLGYSRNGGDISDSYSTGSVVSTYWEVGGLVGYNNDGTIDNSYSTCSVSGSRIVGGLIGVNRHDGVINNSYSSGTVNCNTYVGGLVGDNYGLIINSYSTGTVSGSTVAGGLVARHAVGTVRNCYSISNVSGSSYVAGLVGFCSGSGTLIDTSYSTGNVSGGSLYVGGLVGYKDSTITVSDSYWDTETSGESSSSGGVGKTTTEMVQEATYQPAWDFVGDPDPDDVWKITEGVTYPCLSWQGDETCP